jgi:ubiquitin C-terminal hydrolase
MHRSVESSLLHAYLVSLDIMAPSAGQSVVPTRYTLYEVLSHHGKSAGGENYTVDVHYPNTHGDSRDVWPHIDINVIVSM